MYHVTSRGDRRGTIYHDDVDREAWLIESAGKGKKGQTIKSHHNVRGLPETLNLKLLEPLRELFKDEVRKLGVALGLPHNNRCHCVRHFGKAAGDD